MAGLLFPTPGLLMGGGGQTTWQYNGFQDMDYSTSLSYSGVSSGDLLLAVVVGESGTINITATGYTSLYSGSFSEGSDPPNFDIGYIIYSSGSAFTTASDSSVLLQKFSPLVGTASLSGTAATASGTAFPTEPPDLASTNINENDLVVAFGVLDGDFSSAVQSPGSGFKNTVSFAPTGVLTPYEMTLMMSQLEAGPTEASSGVFPTQFTSIGLDGLAFEWKAATASFTQT